jgi:hypothetical protein
VTENERTRPVGEPGFQGAPAPAHDSGAPEYEEHEEHEGPATAPIGESEHAAAPEQPGRLRRYRLAFRAWRRTRPFWGGLLTLLGGGEILLTYHAPFGIILHFGLYGLAGFMVPAMLAVLGLLIIFDSPHRTFYAVLAVLASLATWLTSNLGGFVIGMLLGLVGGSMAFGWQPGERPARKRRRLRAGATG